MKPHHQSISASGLTFRPGVSTPPNFERIRKDGTRIWIEATYNPVFDRRGRVERVIKLATDITAKRLARFDF